MNSPAGLLNGIYAMTAGETVYGSRSWKFTPGLFGATLDGFSVSEDRQSRLSINDILLATDAPGRNITCVRRGDGYAQFGGMPFKMDSVHHISRKKFEGLLEKEWPPADDRMVVVAPPGHALANKKRVTLRQLAAHTLVVREVGSGLRYCFEKVLDRAGRSLSELHVALELGSNEAIKEAVLRGVGVALLSTLAVRKEVAGGRLLALEVEGLVCDRELFVVTDRRRVLPPPARLFVTHLEAVPDLAS
jgi:hypothetical protein